MFLSDNLNLPQLFTWLESTVPAMEDVAAYLLAVSKFTTLTMEDTRSCVSAFV